MEGHHGTWFKALEPLLPEHLRHVISPVMMGNWLVMIVLLVLMWLGCRRLGRVPRGWQNFWEWTCEVFRGFAVSVIGPGGEKYMSFLATTFIYIFCLNLLGLIPGLISPTTSINMTIALSLVAVVATQYWGIKAHGLNYFKHFLGEPLWLAPLNIILHVIGELAKPLSLSIRLFGNIFGEETVVAELLSLAGKILQSIYVPLPFHLIMVAFAIFGSFIQALIFTMLTAVYISMAVGGEKHDSPAGTVVSADEEAEVVGA